MKFKFLICISLLFSMFHAAAVPIINSVTTIQADAPVMECMSLHCNTIMQDDKEAKKCCSGAIALQPPSQLQIMISNPDNIHTSLSPSLIRYTPDVLFRPPKSYPFLAEFSHLLNSLSRRTVKLQSGRLLALTRQSGVKKWGV